MNYIGELLDGGAYTVAGNSYYPYRPHEDGGELSQRGRFIGIDCLGLIWRSASYSGNPYRWAAPEEPGMVLWAATGSRPFGWPDATPSNVMLVGSSIPTSFPPNLDPEIPALRYVKPGDVVVYHNSDGQRRHFAMVEEVVPNADGSVSLSGITLIESSHRRLPLMTGAKRGQTMGFYEEQRYNTSDPYGAWEVYRLRNRE